MNPSGEERAFAQERPEDGNLTTFVGTTALGGFFVERAIDLAQYGMAVEGESVVTLGVLALGAFALASREAFRFWRSWQAENTLN